MGTVNDEMFAGWMEDIVDALRAIDASLTALTVEVRRLGLNNANTELGALELVAKEIREAGTK